jgi:uncharacterized protein with PIN domain/sulfur carrier protein ThiS
MKYATIRFYAALNDFLAPERKAQSSLCTFYVSRSVKDLVESLGVPHTEVELILVNGRPVNFAYRVEDGDRISVYPPFRSLDISSLQPLRPESPEEFRFVADTHLGRLAAYLRMLGFDTWYERDSTDEALAAISADEDRILLTRDRGLLKRTVVTRGHFVQTTDPSRQLVEVLQRFDLVPRMRPFRRCIHCNAILQPVSKEQVIDRLLPETRQYYDEFFLCPRCGHVYWKGSHYRRMQHFISSVIASS